MRVERGARKTVPGGPPTSPEQRRKALASKRKRKADAKDLEIIDRRADDLNAEAEDVLDYQSADGE